MTGHMHANYDTETEKRNTQDDEIHFTSMNVVFKRS